VSNETPAEMTTASLSAMKLPELKALAASRGLHGISRRTEDGRIVAAAPRDVLPLHAPGAVNSEADSGLDILAPGPTIAEVR